MNPPVSQSAIPTILFLTERGMSSRLPTQCVSHSLLCCEIGGWLWAVIGLFFSRLVT